MTKNKIWRRWRGRPGKSKLLSQSFECVNNGTYHECTCSGKLAAKYARRESTWITVVQGPCRQLQPLISCFTKMTNTNSTSHAFCSRMWNFHQTEHEWMYRIQIRSALRMCSVQLTLVTFTPYNQHAYAAQWICCWKMLDDCQRIVRIVKINMHELLKWMNALTPHRILCTEKSLTKALPVGSQLAFQRYIVIAHLYNTKKKSPFRLSVLFRHLSTASRSYVLPSFSALFFVWLQNCCNGARTTTMKEESEKKNCWIELKKCGRNSGTRKKHISITSNYT